MGGTNWGQVLLNLVGNLGLYPKKNGVLLRHFQGSKTDLESGTVTRDRGVWMRKQPQSLDLLRLECLSESPAGEMEGAWALKGFQEGECCFRSLTYSPTITTLTPTPNPV